MEEMERRQPRLAARARERLVDPGVVLVVSIRKDGTPRLRLVGEPEVVRDLLIG